MNEINVESEHIDISGLYDLHIHTSPDVRPRELDDFDAARQAFEAGMAGIGLKSHVTSTAARAVNIHKLFPDINVVGGIVLNEQVGGINPAAVESALSMGAKIVWMPTISARNHRIFHGFSDGIFLQSNDKFRLPLVLEQIAKSNAVLATGHISLGEITILVKMAVEIGITKIVVTHPEVPWISMPLEMQKELAKLGVFFERCFVSTLEVGGGVPVERIINDIKAVGVETTIISTDYGVKGCGTPVNGLRLFISRLIEAGFHLKDIKKMAGDNPGFLIQ